MNTHEKTSCGRAEGVRDYAFGELAGAELRSMERHLAECFECAAELDQLRLTTAALRVLPEQDVPRRIAFVSDRVFERGWLGSIWNSAARLGFASACVLAAGLSFAAYRFTPGPSQTEVHTVAQTAEIPKSVLDRAVSDAVNQAVALAVQKTHAEDLQLTKTALAAVDDKYEQKQRNLMIAMQENLDYVRKQLNLRTIAELSTDTPRMGATQ